MCGCAEHHYQRAERCSQQASQQRAAQFISAQGLSKIGCNKLMIQVNGERIWAPKRDDDRTNHQRGDPSHSHCNACSGLHAIRLRGAMASCRISRPRESRSTSRANSITTPESTGTSFSAIACWANRPWPGKPVTTSTKNAPVIKKEM